VHVAENGQAKDDKSCAFCSHFCRLLLLFIYSPPHTRTGCEWPNAITFVFSTEESYFDYFSWHEDWKGNVDRERASSLLSLYWDICRAPSRHDCSLIAPSHFLRPSITFSFFFLPFYSLLVVGNETTFFSHVCCYI